MPTRLSDALFPRAAASLDRDYGTQVIGAGLDLASLPGRALQSIGDVPRGESYLEALGRTEPLPGPLVSRIPQAIMRDPSTPLTAGLTGLALRASRAAPVIADVMASALGNATARAGERRVGGGVSSVGDVYGDAAEGALMPAALGGLRLAARAKMAADATAAIAAMKPTPKSVIFPKAAQPAPPPANLFDPTHTTLGGKMPGPGIVQEKPATMGVARPASSTASERLTDRNEYARTSRLLMRASDIMADPSWDWAGFHPLRDANTSRLPIQRTTLDHRFAGQLSEEEFEDMIRAGITHFEAKPRLTGMPLEVSSHWAPHLPDYRANIDPRTLAGKNFNEFYRNSVAYDELGNPTTFFHASPYVIQSWDPKRSLSASLFGRGLNLTPGSHQAYEFGNQGFLDLEAALSRLDFNATNPKTATHPHYGLSDEDWARINVPPGVKFGRNVKIYPSYVRTERPLLVRSPTDILPLLGLPESDFDRFVIKDPDLLREVDTRLDKEGFDAIWRRHPEQSVHDIITVRNRDQVRSATNGGLWGSTGDHRMNWMLPAVGVGAGLAAQANQNPQQQ